MDKGLRKDVLKILRQYDHAVYLSDVLQILYDKNFGYKKTNVFKKQVRDYLRIMQESGYVIIREFSDFRGRNISTYTLSEQGYAEFNPWYKGRGSLSMTILRSS
jgi:hypothetical protein